MTNRRWMQLVSVTACVLCLWVTTARGAEVVVAVAANFVPPFNEIPDLVKGEDPLRSERFKHLAIANPKTAPYGVAAMQAMQKLGVWESLQPRLVLGENLGQTIGFIESGNAELGFLALSQVMDPKMKGKGGRWDVPSNLHEPIKQDVVLLAKGKENPAAKALMDFMGGPQATAIIERYGYELK